MMEIGAVQRIAAIQDRIREIEGKVGFVKTLPDNSFAQKLDREMKKNADAATKADETAAVAGTAVKQSEESAKVAPVEKTFSSEGDLTDLVRQAAQKYGVDPKLVSAVVEAESGGDQSVISSAGAIGVMQLMPETAASLGVDPYDKAQNIDGGTKYLSQMLNNFGGDVRKAVAAYNAGPQAVRDYNGVPPYRETQAYVDRVLDIYK